MTHRFHQSRLSKSWFEISLLLCNSLLLTFFILLITTSVHLIKQNSLINNTFFEKKTSQFELKETVIIRIDANHYYYLQLKNEPIKKLTWTELEYQLNRLCQQVSAQAFIVWIKGEENVPYAFVLQVVSLLQSLQIQSIGLLTKT